MKSSKASNRDGEYVIKGSTIRSAARLNEYLKERKERKSTRVRNVSWPERQVYHVIRPEYCKMLGINPDEMIAIDVDDVWVRIFEADIAKHFHAMPESIPLSSRIFEAHSKAYDGGMDDIMAFVKERFFSQFDL